MLTSEERNGLQTSESIDLVALSSIAAQWRVSIDEVLAYCTSQNVATPKFQGEYLIGMDAVTPEFIQKFRRQQVENSLIQVVQNDIQVITASVNATNGSVATVAAETESQNPDTTTSTQTKRGRSPSVFNVPKTLKGARTLKNIADYIVENATEEQKTHLIEKTPEAERYVKRMLSKFVNAGDDNSKAAKNRYTKTWNQIASTLQPNQPSQNEELDDEEGRGE